MVDKKVPHLTSNDPVIFGIQALITAGVLFAISYIIYLFMFGQNNLEIVQDATLSDAVAQDVSSATAAIEQGIDETMFFEGAPSGVDEEKIDGLFPQLKN